MRAAASTQPLSAYCGTPTCCQRLISHMDRRIKATVLYLIDARSIILAFALFNFILVWTWDREITFACVVCPWYHPWSYTNEPTILLVAALSLRANRWWGNAIAFVLPGYLISSFVYLLSRIEDPVAGLRGDWRLIRKFSIYCRLLGQPICLCSDHFLLFHLLPGEGST